MATHTHTPAPNVDKPAAFRGLVIAMLFLLAVVVTIVKLTNAKYAGEKHEATAAETH
jgi:hypothetical protein